MSIKYVFGAYIYMSSFFIKDKWICNLCQVSDRHLILNTCTLFMIWGFCVWSFFCYAVLSVLSSSAIILEQRVGCFTLTIFLMSCVAPWVGLLCVIMIFPGHTHSLSGK